MLKAPSIRLLSPILCDTPPTSMSKYIIKVCIFCCSFHNGYNAINIVRMELFACGATLDSSIIYCDTYSHNCIRKYSDFAFYLVLICEFYILFSVAHSSFIPFFAISPDHSNIVRHITSEVKIL